MGWDFQTEPEYEEKLAWARDFVHDEVLPLETLDLTHEQYRRVIAPLQKTVKDFGLWAAHLSPEMGGQGMGQVKLGLLHEILGASTLVPSVFGCQAPDSGNTELLALAGTAEQKRRWMQPVLDGRSLSAFSMTEPDTGSDPKQFRTTARRDGDEWVITGRKWFVTNADRAAFHIVMCVTDPGAHAYSGMSMIIVPTDSSGLRLTPIGTMDDPTSQDPVQTHCEVLYEDVRVPVENLLGKEGQAFVLAQRRLGPGRIHHAMRWLGVAQRAFDMMCERAVSKGVHGSLLQDKQTIQNWIADSAAEISAARLMTMHAAWKIDRFGAESTRTEISMIKYWGAKVMLDVVDRSIQVHGSLGFSAHLPLEGLYRWGRASRIYDGPDEVHRVTVARRVLREFKPRDIPSEHVPTRRLAAQAKYAGILATGE